MATITEDYVSFETAKLLREKYFDCRCACINHPQCGMSLIGHMINNTDLQLTREYELCIDKENLLTIPTLQMACRWLVAVHNLFITFELDFSDGAYPMFDAVVYNLATCEKYPIINYDRYSYIKGTEAAIKYCLEHLI